MNVRRMLRTIVGFTIIPVAVGLVALLFTGGNWQSAFAMSAVCLGFFLLALFSGQLVLFLFERAGTTLREDVRRELQGTCQFALVFAGCVFFTHSPGLMSWIGIKHDFEGDPFGRPSFIWGCVVVFGILFFGILRAVSIGDRPPEDRQD